MTTREEFTKAALTGMLAHATRYRPREANCSDWHKSIAAEAVEIADAQMEALGLICNSDYTLHDEAKSKESEASHES
jgi:hypothetical protein